MKRWIQASYLVFCKLFMPLISRFKDVSKEPDILNLGQVVKAQFSLFLTYGSTNSKLVLR